MIIWATQLFALLVQRVKFPLFIDLNTGKSSQVSITPLILSILTKENSFPLIREISLITMLQWTHQI